jgi:chromosome partitioning protein
MNTKIVSVVNQKGGVGKTTSAINIATSFAALNKKTLLIDLDSQANATSSFDIRVEKGVYELLTLGDRDVIVNTKIRNLDIMPSSIDLGGVDLEIANEPRREYILSSALSAYSDYEYIIIDCPPSLGLLTVNALAASKNLIIPMQCEFYSLDGLSKLLNTVKLIQKNLNSKLSVAGILLTMYDKRNKLTEQVEKDVRNCLGDLVFRNVIPRNVRVSEAPSHGLPVILYDSKSTGAIAYIQLAKEILEKGVLK